MTVHSFHILDRKGKTLFTKQYIKNLVAVGPADDNDENLSEQRKHIF
jgi:hypothetical protein